MYRGDDVTFTVTPSATLTSDDHVAWTAKSSLTDLDAEAILSGSTFDDVVSIAQDGKVSVSIASADTEDLTMQTRLYWDLQANIEGKVSTVAAGSLDILLDVTQTNLIAS